MPDARDERIAELEARIDRLVEAIAKLASERPTVVYQVPYVPYVPAPLPSWPTPQWTWRGPETIYDPPVTIVQSARASLGLPQPQPERSPQRRQPESAELLASSLGGTVSNRGEIGTMLPRPSPTMTVLS